MKAILSIVSLAFLPQLITAQCVDTINFAPSTAPGIINWDQFPEFDLPFTLVYQGPRDNDSTFTPLRHGFSHLAKFNDYDFQHLPPEKRAILYPRVATPNEPQPWGEAEIPWNNDMEVYAQHWYYLVNHFFNDFYDYNPGQIPNADIVVADIEAARSLSEIPEAQAHPSVPANIQQLGDFEFVLAYRSEMVKRYNDGLQFLKNATAVSAPQISSYSDTPILRYFDEIGTLSWDYWSGSPYPLNYLTMDTTFLLSYGPVYQVQDFLTPSAYYFYDYPDERAPDYLSYLLFQMEVNRTRSDKPQVPFVWLNYHNCCADSLKNIQPYMAEATAIFPLMSGADGLWVWDHRKNEGIFDTSHLYNYEYFVKGLYRLSLFKDYFTECHGFASDGLAYDHFLDNTPIWRGVVQGNKILIAANNPYADGDMTTTLTIKYKGWETIVTLQGRETYLCEHVWAPEFTSVNVSDGAQLTATDTTAVAYLWSNGATTPAILPEQSGIYGVTVTDEFGCSYEQIFYVWMTTGAENISGDRGFTGILENILPSGSDLTLISNDPPGACEVRITGPLGNILQEDFILIDTAYEAYPVGPLPAGVYYLTVNSENASDTIPFVVQ